MTEKDFEKIFASRLNENVFTDGISKVKDVAGDIKDGVKEGAAGVKNVAQGISKTATELPGKAVNFVEEHGTEIALGVAGIAALAVSIFGKDKSEEAQEFAAQLEPEIQKLQTARDQMLEFDVKMLIQKCTSAKDSEYAARVITALKPLAGTGLAAGKNTLTAKNPLSKKD